MSVDLTHVDKERFADEDDFLRLVSSQIVLKVLNNSIKILQNASLSSTIEEPSSTTTTNTNKSGPEASSSSVVIGEPATTNTKTTNKNDQENYVNSRKHLNLKRWSVV